MKAMQFFVTLVLLCASLTITLNSCSSDNGAQAQSPATDRAAQAQYVNPAYLEKVRPENATLIMVDYLTGFDPGLKTIPKPLYLKNVSALAQLGKIFKLPTIILGDEGGFRGKFYKEIDQYLPNAPKIERHAPSAWSEPKFVKQVADYGHKKLIIAGISLDNCVTQLSLDALKAGYEVYIVVDVSGSDEKLVEQAAMMRLTQAGAVMTSWVSLASELMGDWNTPEGPLVGKLYAENSAWGGNMPK